jgi:prophage regulatory protein
MEQKILRLPELKSITGYARSTVYLYVENGLFPKPVKIGSRSVGWPSNEVLEIMKARISGQNNNQIKELVSSLMASRLEA